MSISNWRGLLVATGLGMTVASCASAPSSSSSTPSADGNVPGVAPGSNASVGYGDYYPLTPGLIRAYRVTKTTIIKTPSSEDKTDKPGTVTETTIGLDSAGATVVRRRVVEHNPRLPQPVVVEVDHHVVVLNGTVALLGVTPIGKRVAADARPQLLLSSLPQTEPWPMKNASLNLSVSHISQGPEPVVVPVGEFPGAIKVVIRGVGSGIFGNVRTESVTVDEATWYARGVGVVKNLRVLRFTTGDLSASDTSVRELTNVSDADPTSSPAMASCCVELGQ